VLLIFESILPQITNINVYHTRKTCDNLKKQETTDICTDAGDFQLGIASIDFHFSSSTNEINASLSLAPRY